MGNGEDTLPLWTDIIPCPKQNTFVQCISWTHIHGSPVARKHQAWPIGALRQCLEIPRQNLENGLVTQHKKMQPHSIRGPRGTVAGDLGRGQMSSQSG